MFDCTANLLGHIRTEMEKLGQKNLPAEVLERQLQSIALAGLALLFDKISEKLQTEDKLDLGTIIKNGFKYKDLLALDSQPTDDQIANLKDRWSADLAKAEAALEGLEAAAKGKSDFFLLHLDECQVILLRY